MELTEIKNNLLALFGVNNNEEIFDKVFQIIKENKVEIYEKYLEIFNNDLETDYLQKLFEYYFADRKEKMQDYTPKCISKLIAGLIPPYTSEIIDMCAGTGSLTIQTIDNFSSLNYKLYEYDDKVLSFLLFNLIIRNLNAEVYHKDVLRNEIFKKYIIKSGDKFGVMIIEDTNI